jgi:hypothetical protein
VDEVVEVQGEGIAVAVPDGVDNSGPRGFNYDDYLTVMIRKNFDLGDDWKNDTVKVSWSDIEEVWSSFDDTKKKEKEDYWSFLQRNRHGRMKRYEILEEVLERHGLKIRSDSKLCRDFVFKNVGDKRRIVQKMYTMKTCYDNGVNEKFKVYLDDLKTKNPTAVSPDRIVSLRDMFFDRFYQDYILENPEKEFRWKPHPYVLAQQSMGGDSSPVTSSPSSGFTPVRGRGGNFRGRGGNFRGGQTTGDGFRGGRGGQTTGDGFRGGSFRGRGGVRGRGGPSLRGGMSFRGRN